MTYKTKKFNSSLIAGRQGFTLVETLVAVLLLATAIAGPLTIASRGLTASVVAKDQVIAYYLAQDAVEYVRWIRDTNKLGNQNWLAGLNGVSNGHTSNGSGGTDNCIGTSCKIETIGAFADRINICTPIDTAACAIVYYDPDAGDKYYTHTTGGNNRQTIFRRTISLTALPTNANEYMLTATVKWSDTSGALRKVEIQENLYDWQ